MKKATLIISIVATIAIPGCGGKTSNPQDHQSSPQAVAEAIFEAARTGDYGGLTALIDDNGDADSKRIGSVATDSKTREQFKTYFEKGKLNGEPLVNGDKASVKILFGPDGDKEETFEMVRKDDKWYLHSF